MSSVIPILIDGFALGALYCVIGWAFAFDSLSRGYLHVALGDLAILLLATGWLVIGRGAEQLSVSALVAGGVGLAAAYWCARQLLHKLVYTRVGATRSHMWIIIAGLAIALMCTSILELTCSRVLWKSLNVRSMAPSIEAFGETMAPRDVVTLLTAGVVSLCLVAAHRHRLVKAGRLVRDNRALATSLRLPVQHIDRWSSVLAAVLISTAVWLYLCRYPLRPEAGLRITILGFVLATTASRRLLWIGVLSILLGVIERVVGSGLVPIQAYWAPHIAIAILVIIAAANRETWRLKIVEGPIRLTSDG